MSVDEINFEFEEEQLNPRNVQSFSNEAVEESGDAEIQPAAAGAGGDENTTEKEKKEETEIEHDPFQYEQVKTNLETQTFAAAGAGSDDDDDDEFNFDSDGEEEKKKKEEVKPAKKKFGPSSKQKKIEQMKEKDSEEKKDEEKKDEEKKEEEEEKGGINPDILSAVGLAPSHAVDQYTVQASGDAGQEQAPDAELEAKEEEWEAVNKLREEKEKAEAHLEVGKVGGKEITRGTPLYEKQAISYYFQLDLSEQESKMKVFDFRKSGFFQKDKNKTKLNGL